MIKAVTVQEIHNKIDIIDVIGDFIKLKRRGTNYLGLCPFHGEKSPSFTVSPAKEIYKCFGCGKSGNTITFLMEHEKLSYIETLRWLAKRYGIEVEEEYATDEVKQTQQAAESLHIINQFAQQYFTTQLLDTNEGKNIALSYLLERGFTMELIKKFQIGYCLNERNAFAKEALSKQYNEDLLIKTGLVTTRNDELVDNYRGRIIFPIHGISGKVIGFGARVIGKADKAPKYINTPENEVYSKSKILYGLYFARQVINKADECLLVEGYTDVTALYQSGIENVVASGGTSLTTEQLRLIKKFTNNLTIIYDGDNAGVKAALRGLDMAIEEGLNVKLVMIPDNEDPDSYVKKVGELSFKKFVADNKQDFILFQLQVMLKDAGNDIIKKNEVVNQIAETLSKMTRQEDFAKQQSYVNKCASLLKIDEGGLIGLISKLRREKLQKEDVKNSKAAAEKVNESSTNNTVLLDGGFNNELHQKNVLKVLLEHGLKTFNEELLVADYIFSELASFHLENPLYDSLYEAYRKLLAEGKNPDTKFFLYHENDAFRQLVHDINITQYEQSPKWSEKLTNSSSLNEDNTLFDVITSVQLYKLRIIKKTFQEIQERLENETDFEKQKGIVKLFIELKKMEKEATEVLGTVILK